MRLTRPEAICEKLCKCRNDLERLSNIINADLGPLTKHEHFQGTRLAVLSPLFEAHLAKKMFV